MTRSVELVPARPGELAQAPNFAGVVLGSEGLIEATRHFLTTKLANEHTRDNYRRSVVDFLKWCFTHAVRVDAVTPEVMDHYRDHLVEQHGTSTVLNKLAALSRYYRHLAQERLVTDNPAEKTERPKHQRDEGVTPLIPAEQARILLDAIDATHVVGLRDRAVIGILSFTAARVGAIAKLSRGDFRHDGTQHVFHFTEKRGKERTIPARHDLEGWMLEYIEAASLDASPKDAPLFRTAAGKTKTLTEKPMTPNDMHRMLKRRLKEAGLSGTFSCHSFRTMAATNLLEQGVPIEDVQYLLGHKDTRTTSLYDRRKKRVTRNIVERISI